MKLKVKYVLAFFLAVVMINSISATAFAAPVSDNLEDILWDWEYYYNDNPDVRALGRSDSTMRNHYLTYGKNEGRSPSSLFDPVYYLNKYSDLKKAFGNNYAAAYNHFITFGVVEGRQGSASFNVQMYKNNYADLRNAFGTGSADNYKYLKHWREFGQKEGRVANRVPSPIPTPSQTNTYYVKTNGANLTVRSGAGTSYAVLGYLANGTQVSVYSISNNWAKIDFDGKTGYVSITYLTQTKNEKMSYALYHTTSARITCGFDGYVNTSGRHEGIDISYQNGKPVYSLTDGVVIRVTYGKNGSSGLSTIAIYDSAANKTVIYLHTNPVDLYVGQPISKGEKIATQGWRGVSSASAGHTHVEVRSGRRESAAKSVGDPTLENSNPTSYWNSKGYIIQ